MNAKKCDRCGVYYDHYVGQREGYEGNAIAVVERRESFIFGSGNSTIKIIDICPECTTEFVDWLEGPLTIQAAVDALREGIREGGEYV